MSSEDQLPAADVHNSWIQELRREYDVLVREERNSNASPKSRERNIRRIWDTRGNPPLAKRQLAQDMSTVHQNNNYVIKSSWYK